MTQRRVNVREYVPRVKQHHHRPSKNNIALFIIYRYPENQRVYRDLKQVVLEKKTKTIKGGNIYLLSGLLINNRRKNTLKSVKQL